MNEHKPSADLDAANDRIAKLEQEVSRLTAEKTRLALSLDERLREVQALRESGASANRHVDTLSAQLDASERDLAGMKLRFDRSQEQLRTWVAWASGVIYAKAITAWLEGDTTETLITKLEQKLNLEGTNR